MTLPWKLSLGSAGGVNRQGLAAVNGEEVDRDFLVRVAVKGLTGVTVAEPGLGEVGGAIWATGGALCFGDAAEGLGAVTLAICFGVEGVVGAFGDMGGEL